MNRNTTEVTRALIAWVKAHPNRDFTNQEAADAISAVINKPVDRNTVSGALSNLVDNVRRGRDHAGVTGLRHTGHRATWHYEPGGESISLSQYPGNMNGPPLQDAAGNEIETRGRKRQVLREGGPPVVAVSPGSVGICVGQYLEVMLVGDEGEIVVRTEAKRLLIVKDVTTA